MADRAPVGPLLGRKIIKAVLLEHGVTAEAFFSKRRHDRLVEARVDAAQRLERKGYTVARISRLLKREYSVVAGYLHPDWRARRKKRVRNNAVRFRAFRLLGKEIGMFVIEYAEAEGVSFDVLLAEWISERARYEVEAKARAA